MIYSLRGKLTHKTADLAVVECAGVGYACRTTSYTLSPLKVGEEVFLLTHMNVREDAVELFGFGEAAELNCFRLLLSVTGVGPKAALSILSGMSPQGFALCVAQGDTKLLTRTPGIGKKIADRIILELKDKMTDRIGEISSDTYAELSKPTVTNTGNAAEAITALTALGFTGTQAQKALAGLSPEMPVSELVREALKKIGSIK
ncbi:MAG: Holliday junction branch migration protein RuvA [Ruminiclostridium sp.]|nr:Holliday junction branch migration protein RuvA [Ruminiclostridium sp.]